MQVDLNGSGNKNIVVTCEPSPITPKFSESGRPMSPKLKTILFQDIMPSPKHKIIEKLKLKNEHKD
jgi:hypothetical protein